MEDPALQGGCDPSPRQSISDCRGKVVVDGQCPSYSARYERYPRKLSLPKGWTGFFLVLPRRRPAHTERHGALRRGRIAPCLSVWAGLPRDRGSKTFEAHSETGKHPPDRQTAHTCVHTNTSQVMKHLCRSRRHSFDTHKCRCMSFFGWLQQGLGACG